MSGIGPLLPSRFEPAALPSQSQNGIEQPLLRLSLQEPRAEFGENGIIEAGIGEFQSQRIFPVNPTTDGVRRLAVWEVFRKLHHNHQCQSSGSLRRLSLRRKEVGKLLICEERSEFIAHLEPDIALRKRGLSDQTGHLRNSLFCFGLEGHRFFS